MTRRRVLIGCIAASLAIVVTALPTGQLRHLAMPIVHDPSTHPSMRCMTIDEDETRATERTRVPGRVSAILPRADGTLFIGTFDSGLYRFDPNRDRAPAEVGALSGRERFVDALVEHDGRIVVATHRGAVVLSPGGARLGVLAAGEAISSLVVAGDELLLGTAHGLWRARDDAALGERSPEGETLRITALTATRGRVWIGTPEGVYAIATPATAQVAYWHPLVFGSPGASSNVVTALAPLADGVLAGTDDGGTVFVDDASVDARPFADRRANDINPGALLRAGDDVFVGTEGAGLIAVAGSHARRIGNSSGGRISAVALGAELWFGSEEGAIYSLAVPLPLTSAPARAPSSSPARG